MDFFEEKEKESEEKKIFVERHGRITKLLRIILSSVFGGLGLLFVILGVVGFFTIEMVFGYVFIGTGSLYIVLAIIFLIVFGRIDSEKAYERYKVRVKNGRMFYSTNEMSMRIVMVEKKVQELEEEIDSLKRNR